MPNNTPVVFKKTLLAAAVVVSLSACSTMPQVPDLGGVGDGIVKAGKATASAGKKTWDTTTYLLGFTDAPGEDADAPSDEQLLVDRTQDQDSVNQALPQTGELADAPILENAAEARPAVVQQATAVIDPEQSATDNLASLPVDALPSDTLPSDTLASNTLQLGPEAPLTAGATASVAIDVVHKVAANETLWDIAKLTTGDATNWHTLADVNDLEQSATVFPGQELIIPAALVKDEYASTLAAISLDTVPGAQEGSDSSMINEPVIAAAVESGESEPLTDQSLTTELAADAQVTDDLVADSAAQLASIEQNATPIELNDGETLWDFAKRTTGDATNWQAIASQNNFTEKQSVTVRPGQTIFVPLDLLKDSAQTSSTDSAQAVDGQTTEEAVVAAVTEAPANVTEATIEPLAAALPATDVQPLIQDAGAEINPEATLTDSAARVAEGSSLQDSGATSAESAMLDETKPLTIVEATYKSDDSLTLTADVEAQQIVENANIPAQIKVSGTYYPKAVYNNADFSSSLLMRVSPGTTLQVTRAMGTWFEVETDKGVGYVHQRDIQ